MGVYLFYGKAKHTGLVIPATYRFHTCDCQASSCQQCGMTGGSGGQTLGAFLTFVERPLWGDITPR